MVFCAVALLIRLASALPALGTAACAFASLAFRTAPEKGPSALHEALQGILKKTRVL